MAQDPRCCMVSQASSLPFRAAAFFLSFSCLLDSTPAACHQTGGRVGGVGPGSLHLVTATSLDVCPKKATDSHCQWNPLFEMEPCMARGPRGRHIHAPGSGVGAGCTCLWSLQLLLHYGVLRIKILKYRHGPATRKERLAPAKRTQRLLDPKKKEKKEREGRVFPRALFPATTPPIYHLRRFRIFVTCQPFVQQSQRKINQLSHLPHVALHRSFLIVRKESSRLQESRRSSFSGFLDSSARSGPFLH